jgi:hypothetical protein
MMKAFLKPTMLFLSFFPLLLSISFSIDINNACATDELWNSDKDGCNHGLHKQPNGPMAVILFCEDALGTYIGLVYYDTMGSPVPDRFYEKLSETEKETYYKIWSLENRMWQNPLWASDVTSYAWGLDGTKLYVATSQIYGSGALYELDLVRRKHKQLAPTGKESKLDKPGLGYLITRMDKVQNKLSYTLWPSDVVTDQTHKEQYYKMK